MRSRRGVDRCSRRRRCRCGRARPGGAPAMNVQLTVSATAIGAAGSVNAVRLIRPLLLGVCWMDRSDAIDTDSPSTTSCAARRRVAGVMRFNVPSSSCGPQRPALEHAARSAASSCVSTTESLHSCLRRHPVRRSYWRRPTPSPVERTASAGAGLSDSASSPGRTLGCAGAGVGREDTMGEFDGRVAIVTGSSSGIGEPPPQAVRAGMQRRGQLVILGGGG